MLNALSAQNPVGEAVQKEPTKRLSIYYVHVQRDKRSWSANAFALFDEVHYLAECIYISFCHRSAIK